MSIPTRSASPLAGTARPAPVNVTFPKMDIFVKFEVWNVKSKKFEPRQHARRSDGFQLRRRHRR